LSAAPRIETERLILRELLLSDFEDYTALWSEPEVLRYTQRDRPGPELMWARFLRNAGFWRHLGFGFFAVEEKATGRFVGQVGFFDAHREIEPPIVGLAEAGWTLREAFHGRGYGFEATSALMNWGSAVHAGRTAVAIIDVENRPSLGLARRLGFEPWVDTTYQGHAIHLLRRVL
jgi:RimJ/RimL family protein N-acetyltransferase